MDDTQDNTLVDNVGLLESPRQPSEQPSQPPVRDQTLEEILAQSSTDLIHSFVNSINQSVVKEAARDEQFRQELKRRLLRAIIRTYVWSTARLAREIETSEASLSDGVQRLVSAEREQGRSSPPPTMLERLRGRLCELMAAVSRAVEMFAQF